MFFKFFSNKIYPMGHWALVFRIENAIQAMVRVTWTSLLDLSTADLEKVLSKKLNAVKTEKQSEKLLIQRFVKHESKYLFRFFHRLTIEERIDITKAEEKLRPKAMALSACVRKSKLFRQFCIDGGGQAPQQHNK